VSLSDTNSEYYCVVTGACGFATSTKATLTVDPDNRISLNPIDAEVCEGSQFTFEVKFSNTTTGCVWQYRESDIHSFIDVELPLDYNVSTTATTSILTLNSATTNMSDWTFRAKVQRAGFEDNFSSEVSVNVHQPATFEDLISLEICKSKSISFDKKKTSGTGTFTYEWKKGSTVLDASASILNLEAANDLPGDYSVQVINDYCTYPVDKFSITHYEDIDVNGFSDIKLICLNPTEKNILSVSATTDPSLSLSYAWLKSKGPLVGITNKSTYTVPAVNVSESDYYEVSVSDLCMSHKIGFNIEVPADVVLSSSITTPVIVCEDKDLNLSVEGQGDDLLYSWYKVDAPSDTLSKTSKLHISGMTMGQAGVYHCNLSTESSCSTDDLDFTVNVLEKAKIKAQGINYYEQNIRPEIALLLGTFTDYVVTFYSFILCETMGYRVGD